MVSTLRKIMRSASKRASLVMYNNLRDKLTTSGRLKMSFDTLTLRPEWVAFVFRASFWFGGWWTTVTCLLTVVNINEMRGPRQDRLSYLESPGPRIGKNLKFSRILSENPEQIKNEHYVWWFSDIFPWYGLDPKRIRGNFSINPTNLVFTLSRCFASCVIMVLVPFTSHIIEAGKLLNFTKSSLKASEH